MALRAPDPDLHGSERLAHVQVVLRFERIGRDCSKHPCGLRRSDPLDRGAADCAWRTLVLASRAFASDGRRHHSRGYDWTRLLPKGAQHHRQRQWLRHHVPEFEPGIAALIAFCLSPWIEGLGFKAGWTFFAGLGLTAVSLFVFSWSSLRQAKPEEMDSQEGAASAPLERKFAIRL